MISTAMLPDDPAVLKGIVVDQVAEIEHLKFVIAKARRIHFGRRSPNPSARRPDHEQHYSLV